MSVLRKMLSIFFSGALLLLSACVMKQPVTPQSTQALARLAHQAWHESGVFSYCSKQDALTGSFIWTNAPAGYEVQMIGPLGAARARLSVNAEGAVLVTSSGKTFSAADIEELMHMHLGWSVPVERLRYWLLGQVAPHQAFSSTRDVTGVLSAINQAGWLVQYTERQNFAGYDLPKRIILTHEDKKMILVVQQFT